MLVYIVRDTMFLGQTRFFFAPNTLCIPFLKHTHVAKKKGSAGDDCAG